MPTTALQTAITVVGIDIGKNSFHVVGLDMAWSVDRLGRSLQNLVSFLSELHALRIDLFLKVQGIDTTTPAGKALFQMMGVFAEFERSMIQERVRAGLRRATDEDKRPGWPPVAPELEKRIRAALEAGMGGEIGRLSRGVESDPLRN